MNEETFLEMSAVLTGFAVFDLRATGLVGDYHHKTIESVEAAGLAEVEATFGRTVRASADDRQAAVETMMASASVGLIMRRILMLWYTGSWYISPPYDALTLSGRSYVQGLMWKAIGAHPMAAAPQGYGAWSLPPPDAGL